MCAVYVAYALMCKCMRVVCDLCGSVCVDMCVYLNCLVHASLALVCSIKAACLPNTHLETA